jgi:hypothetical protein
MYQVMALCFCKSCKSFILPGLKFMHAAWPLGTSCMYETKVVLTTLQGPGSRFLHAFPLYEKFSVSMIGVPGTYSKANAPRIPKCVCASHTLARLRTQRSAEVHNLARQCLNQCLSTWMEHASAW